MARAGGKRREAAEWILACAGKTKGMALPPLNPLIPAKAGIHPSVLGYTSV